MMRAKVSLPSARVPAPRRTLVADDNEVVLAVLQGLLQSLGHSVDVVTNGRAAVEAATREDFDLVFLDVQMPELDGFQVARSLRHRLAGRSRPCIIGLSAERAESESHVAAGMNDFLIKPVRYADLVHALKVHYLY